MEPLDLSTLLVGPVSGLALSTFFCFQFLQRFESTTESLVQLFKLELEECNKRYNLILQELMQLKAKRYE